MSRPHWSEWKRAIAMTPDWEALRRASASIIEVHGRRATPPHRSVGFYEAFRDALTTCCGSWCSAGQLPGDESARGWCWCHSPWKGWEGPTRPAIERAVASVVDEVRACLQWHRQMAAVIEASAAPGEDPDALALLIVALVDQIVALGIHDAWYPSIAPVVAWALERHGVEVDEATEEAILALTERSFQSWSTPAVRDVRDFAEQAALELLDRELARRWPSDPEEAAP